MTYGNVTRLFRWLMVFCVTLLAFESAVLAETGIQEPRIIGGVEAEPGEWPWMAALVYADQLSPMLGQFCGGTLIHPNWVLTAAHCASGRGLNIDVVLGTNDLTASPDTYERIPVSSILVHPDYNQFTYENDIALLELSEPSLQTPIPSLVTPANEFSLAFPGEMATVIGWGDTNISPIATTYPAKLMEVDVPLISNSQCQSTYGNWVTSNMICAGYSEGGKDSCYGDSGGPLMVPDGEGSYAQVGIVDWGNGCALASYYGVYTRVPNYFSWINWYVDLGVNCGDYNHDGIRDEADFYGIAGDIFDTYYTWALDCWWSWQECGDYNGDGQLTDDDWYLVWEDLAAGFWVWFYDCSGVD